MMQTMVNTYSYLSKGGPVMALIITCSVVVVTLIIERWNALRRNKILPFSFVSEIQLLANEGKISEILSLCRITNIPLARILLHTLKTESKKTDLQSEMELVGKKEAIYLEKNLDLLGTLAAVGPLLGLLGTVTGMISTFGVIRHVGVGDPLQLSGGIAEALLNTAGGLIVGIPALVFQRFFYNRIDLFVLEMEEISQNVLRNFKAFK